jgi:hypothetical protein
MTNGASLIRPVLIGLGLALVGVATGYGTVSWVASLDADRSSVNFADLGAVILAAALGGLGVIIFLLSLFPGSAGRRSREAPPAAGPDQLSFQRLQAGALVLAGLMLALPLAASPGGSEPDRAVALAAMAGVIACFLVQTALNWTLWRRSDEFLRRLIAETGSLCFWILQAALFLWAAAERLGLAPAADAWSGVVVMMTVYLLASSFINVRNGAGAAV